MRIKKTFKQKDRFGYSYSVYELDEDERIKFGKRYLLDRTICRDALDNMPHDTLIEYTKKYSSYCLGAGLFDTIEEADDTYFDMFRA